MARRFSSPCSTASDRLNLPVKSQEDIIRSDDMPEEMMDPMSRDFKSLIIYNLETSGSVLTVNNQVQIYTDGQAKFEALRNALRQARQYDPQADYVSLWLPELRSVPQHLRHTPFLLSGLQLDALRYPRLEQVPESWKPYLPVAA